MALQNRVDPYGTIFRSPARGTMMGNRGGAIHNEAREIVRRYASRRWIARVLEFRGRKRAVMSPGRYTELFFLDEAVALAAGHRPCAECRRERFRAFQNAWQRWKGSAAAPGASEMDVEPHEARIGPRGAKVTYEAELGSVPDGCFVEVAGSSYLVWNGARHLWTPEGYAGKDRLRQGTAVAVLTPRPIAECIRAGYRPAIHVSAANGSAD
ncbi:MAG TPA: hypothetical protein VKV17_20130 [Bryobacteraceae bacterium]|nr:hypothetical protein [Bryobacteraceae bacterium]